MRKPIAEDFAETFAVWLKPECVAQNVRGLGLSS
jgi:hypothetical protein